MNGSEESNLQRKNSKYMVEVVLRAVALGLTVAAALVMATAKQTTTVSVQVSAALPPLQVPVTAKWHYLSALSFFVVANAIACAYAAFSLLLTLLLTLKKGGRFSRLIIITFDILIVALLFSGNGAASAVGLLGREGNSHVRWSRVCNVFTGFCNRVMAAIVISILASITFFLLPIVSVFRLCHTIRIN